MNGPSSNLPRRVQDSYQRVFHYETDYIFTQETINMMFIFAVLISKGEYLVQNKLLLSLLLLG